MPRLQFIRQPTRRLGNNLKAANDRVQRLKIAAQALVVEAVLETFRQVDMAQHVAERAAFLFRKAYTVSRAARRAQMGLERVAVDHVHRAVKQPGNVFFENSYTGRSSLRRPAQTPRGYRCRCSVRHRRAQSTRKRPHGGCRAPARQAQPPSVWRGCRHAACCQYIRTAPIFPALTATNLDQLQPLEARVAFLADDDVVVHGNAERLGDLDDRLRHLDVGAARRRIADWDDCAPG